MTGKPQPRREGLLLRHVIAPELLAGLDRLGDETALLHAAVNRLATAVEVLVRRADPNRVARVGRNG